MTLNNPNHLSSNLGKQSISPYNQALHLMENLTPYDNYSHSVTQIAIYDPEDLWWSLCVLLLVTNLYQFMVPCSRLSGNLTYLVVPSLAMGDNATQKTCHYDASLHRDSGRPT